MRKVLLRIDFNQFWNLQNVGNETLIGAGWLLLLWCMAATVSLTLLWKSTRDTRQILWGLPFWGIVPLFLLIAPSMSSDMAKNGIPIFGYGFMMFVGFISATMLATWHAKRIDMNPNIIWDLMMWLLIPGLIGARLFYVVQYSDRIFARAVTLQQKVWAVLSLSDGGLVFYGSIVGGVIGGLIFCQRRSIRPLQLADVVAPSLFVGLGFGRIGCFLYGCCYGGACSLPWAVRFPPDSATYAAQVNAGIIKEGVASTTALHPAQIYSSILAFFLAAILTWAFRRRPFEGLVTGLTLVLYPINRFVLEFIRNDEKGQLGTAFTISQLISMVLFTAGIILLVWLTLQNGKNTKPIKPTKGRSREAVERSQ